MNGPRRIRQLPADVAARIAAGEVIERPASVVRELLDNAIDAGARRIAVEIEEGGIDLIRITDDGSGIPPDEVELAFARHATSKITDLGDLGSIRTLGFRGEALPSIAAAAEVEVVTRAAGESVGVHLVLVDGEVVRRQSRSGPQGTTLNVRRLFERLPARRKFLGSAAGEGRAISALVAQYALAYPAIAFTFSSGGRTSLRTAGDGELRHAVGAVYGTDVAARMLSVDTAPDAASPAVHGLVSPPDVARGNRSAVSVFVNGRWVQSRSMTFAIIDAYQSQLPGGRFPIATLAIHVEGDDVDVNVHPTKAEVRFRDERAVIRAVRKAVGEALQDSPAPRWEPSGPVPPSSPGRLEGLSLRERLTAPAVSGPAAAALREPQPVQAELSLPPAFGQSSPTAQRDVMPMLRLVGQFRSTYLVCEGPDGLYLIDQHAAHERVIYDRIIARPGEFGAGQPLLEPAVVAVDAVLDHVAAANLEVLSSLGIELEPFGERTYVVRAVPAPMSASDPAGVVRRVLEDLGADAYRAVPFERAAATVACHSSVRAGMALVREEMLRLLEDLGATSRPRTCPHGRPTIVQLALDAIERQFGRR